MLEEHCHVTDASITTFKNELFNDLVASEARIFKIIARFAAENMGKKGWLLVVEQPVPFFLH